MKSHRILLDSKGPLISETFDISEEINLWGENALKENISFCTDRDIYTFIVQGDKRIHTKTYSAWSDIKYFFQIQEWRKGYFVDGKARVVLDFRNQKHITSSERMVDSNMKPIKELLINVVVGNRGWLNVFRVKKILDL